MNSPKTIRSKLQKLFQLSDLSQKEFADRSKIPTSTVNDYFSREKGLTAVNFFKILSAFKIDLEILIEAQLKTVINGEQAAPSRNSDDIAVLINQLEPSHRRELLNLAINMHKLKKNHVIDDVLDRVSKQTQFLGGPL